MNKIIQIPNIVHKIQRHRVLIFNQITGEISTGTLVDIGKAILVLTAWHNIKKAKTKGIFINLGLPYQDCSFLIQHIWSDQKLDISYLELDRDGVNKYAKAIVPIKFGCKKKMASVYPKYRAVAIVGYPSTEATLDELHKRFQAFTYHVLSQLIKLEEWPTGIESTPEKHLLIEYGSKWGRQFVNEFGKPCLPTNPCGLSGSAIWKFNPDSMHDTEPEYGLIGIQTGWYKKKDLLVGTIIDPMLEKIQQDYDVQF